MNDRNVKPSAIAEEPHRIYSWEDVSKGFYDSHSSDSAALNPLRRKP